MPTMSPFLLALLTAGSGLGLTFIYIVRRDPPKGVVAWVLVLAFVPIWIAVPLIVSWPLVALTGIGCLVAFISVEREPLRLTLIDLLFASLFVVAMSPFFIGRIRLSAFFGVLTVWVPSYLLGRLVTPRLGERWIYSVVAAIFTVVAALAVVEFVTGWHGLAQWGPYNSSRATWGGIQIRSGLSRSEGAFGHSIALGCALAIAAVVTLSSRFRPGVRVLMICIQVAAVAVTLSRVGIICTALGLVLAIVFVDGGLSRAMRWSAAALITVAAVILVPFFADVLASSNEAAGSAAYRGDLLSLVPFIDLFGLSSAMRTTSAGVMYFGGFRSIDSQLVLFGLSYGWMTLGIVLLLLACAATAVLSRRASVATVAVVAQIPALMSVALITQYAYLFWFTAGVAAASHAIRRGDLTVEQAGPSTILDSAMFAGRAAGRWKEASYSDDR